MAAQNTGEVGAMESSEWSKPRVPPGQITFRRMLPRLLNALLWLVFCAMAGTGLLLAFRLPPGSRGGHGLSACGLSRHEWGDWHTWLSYAFLALILMHLALHWRWFWQVAARKKRWPLLLGFGLGLALLLVLALQPVKNTGRGQGRRNPVSSLPAGYLPSADLAFASRLQ